jgi:Flp pilus assembly pilin Flp
MFSTRRGQTLAEYALILALIAVVAIAGLVLLGPAIEKMFKNVAKKI